MKKIFLVFLALLAACSACAPNGHPITPSNETIKATQTLAQDLESKTVAFAEERQDPILQTVSKHVYCSGVWLDSNTIITANHCVADNSLGDMLLYSTPVDRSKTEDDQLSYTRTAILIAVDPDHDLALVRALVAPSHGVAPLAQNVFAGEPDATMGHPLGLLWSYSEGVVAAVRKTDDPDLDILWVQSTAAISPGNSGGGLFNTFGELMGICSRGVFGNAENLNFYVHVNYVRDFYLAHK